MTLGRIVEEEAPGKERSTRSDPGFLNINQMSYL